MTLSRIDFFLKQIPLLTHARATCKVHFTTTPPCEPCDHPSLDSTRPPPTTRACNHLHFSRAQVQTQAPPFFQDLGARTSTPIFLGRRCRHDHPCFARAKVHVPKVKVKGIPSGLIGVLRFSRAQGFRVLGLRSGDLRFRPKVKVRGFAFQG